MSNQRRQSQQRLHQFEEFEKRLMMTADPVGSALPALDLSLPRVVEHVQVAEVASEFPAPEFEAADLMLPLEDSQPHTMDFSPPVETITQLAQVANSATTAAADIGASFGFDGSGQTIAVIDTGIAWDHNALGGSFGQEDSRVVGGWDFAENDADPYDDGPAGFHGTHVAGIIGSSNETYQGVSSGADLVSLRVFDDQGMSDLQWVEQALQWVHEHRNDFENPITTVNLSLGTTWNSETTPEWGILEDELAQLEADGLFISVAAGNSFEDYNTTGLSYPAVSEHVVPVGSHDSNGSISDFSQRSDRILAAPGESIKSTVPNYIFGGSRDNAFVGSSGTSMAAPYVAGASAILREAYESIGVTDINQDLLYQQFRDTANQIFDSVTNSQYLQIDLQAAITAVLAQKPDTPQLKPEAPVAEPLPVPITEPVPVAGHLLDGVLTVEGTAGDDLVVIDATNANYTTITVNGSSQQYEQSAIDRIQVNASLGSDELRVELGATEDSVVLMEGGVTVSNDQYTIDATGFASIDVNNSAGQSTLSVQDTAGNDVVHIDATERGASVQTARFTGTGRGFSEIVATSTGGEDSLTMTGTVDRDRFESGDRHTVLHAGDFLATGDGFGTTALVGNGGWDQATLEGTSQHDVFELSPKHATVTSVDSTVNVSDVSQISVLNGYGGDEVHFEGSTVNDVFYSVYEDSSMRGGGYLNFARGVSEVHVDGAGGQDSAQIYRSTGDLSTVASADRLQVADSGGSTTLEGFESVRVFAAEGHSKLAVSGTEGSDSIDVDQRSVGVRFSTGQQHSFHGFDDVEIDGRGGSDQATLVGTDGDETLRANRSEIEFETTRRMLRMVNTEQVQFDGNGGLDQVLFEGFETLDLLESIGDRATAYLGDQAISAVDFDVLEAETVDEAIADYDLEAIDYLYMLRGKWKPR